MRKADKVDNLNKRILRFILQDHSSPYDLLLSKVNMKSLSTHIMRDSEFLFNSDLRLRSFRWSLVVLDLASMTRKWKSEYVFVFWSPDEISLAVKVDVQCKSFVSALLLWNSDIMTWVHLQLISVKGIFSVAFRVQRHGAFKSCVLCYFVRRIFKKAITLIMKRTLPLTLAISCDACGNFQVVG